MDRAFEWDAGKAGFDALMRGDECYADERVKVKRAAADLGLTINTGYSIPEEYNTISPDAAVRRRAWTSPSASST